MGRGARLAGFSRPEALLIGVAMIRRGKVGLITTVLGLWDVNIGYFLEDSSVMADESTRLKSTVQVDNGS